MPLGTFFYVVKTGEDGKPAVEFYADREAAETARQIEKKSGGAFADVPFQEIELEFDAKGRLLSPDATAAELRAKLAATPEAAPPPAPAADAPYAPTTYSDQFSRAARMERQQAAAKEVELSKPDISEIVPSVDGKVVAFTGKLSLSRPRVKESARVLGARVASIVTENTDLLVVGEDVGSGKVEAARELGITIISEDQWKELVKRAEAKPKPDPAPGL